MYIKDLVTINLNLKIKTLYFVKINITILVNTNNNCDTYSTFCNMSNIQLTYEMDYTLT